MFLSGLATDSQMRNALGSWLVPKPTKVGKEVFDLDAILEERDLGYFHYGVGAAMLWVLEAIEPAGYWQADVEATLSIEEALYSRVNPNFLR